MWPGQCTAGFVTFGNFARASSAVLVSAVVLLPVMAARRSSPACSHGALLRASRSGVAHLAGISASTYALALHDLRPAQPVTTPSPEGDGFSRV